MRVPKEHCLAYLSILYFLSIFLTATPADAGTPQWGSKIAIDDFNRSIERIIAAAREQESFSSLKGQAESQANGAAWQSIVVIPGADICTIDQENITIGDHAVPSFPSYNCSAMYESLEKAMSGYHALQKMLSKATGWKIVDDSNHLTATLCPSRDEKNSCNDVQFKIGLVSGYRVWLMGFGKIPHTAPPKPSGLISAAPALLVLRQAVNAAGESEPFESIKGESDNSNRTRWKATIAFPGTDSCSVLASGAGQRPWYGCVWEYGDAAKAGASYENLLDMVKQDGGWTPRTSMKSERSLQNAIFHTSKAFGVDVSLSQEKDGSVILMLTPMRSDPATGQGDSKPISNLQDSRTQARPTDLIIQKKWGSGISDNSFSSPIHRILAAREEPEPFGSLRGEPDSRGPAFWKSMVSLPGADHCEIDQSPTDTILGTWIGKFYWYLCQSSYDTANNAKKGFDEAVALLAKATSGKIQMDQNSDSHQQKAIIKSDQTGGFAFRVNLEEGSRVSIGLHPDYDRVRASLVTPDLIVAALQRVRLSAEERMPFGSITGERRQGAEQWYTTAAIPEAGVCMITNVSATHRHMYSCVVNKMKDSSSTDSYNRMIDAINKTGDWASVPSTPNGESVLTADFRSKAGNAILNLLLNKENQLMLLIFASKPITVDNPESKGSENEIAARLARGMQSPVQPIGDTAVPFSGDMETRHEIDKIAQSGAYTSMPDAQMAIAAGSGRTTARRILRNSTDYILHIYISGPMDHKIDLAPGGSATTDLPPGLYHMAARVDSPGVLPFYGVQVLEAAIDYTSQFYIK